MEAVLRFLHELNDEDCKTARDCQNDDMAFDGDHKK